MEVYLIFAFMLFLFSFYEIFFPKKKNLRNGLLFISFLGAVLIVGGRWETGTDWTPYEIMFYESNSWQNALELWQTEVGYALLSWLIRSFTDNYSVFLIVHAIIFYGLLLISFKKIIPYPQTAFFFFFITNLGIVGSNRQLLAVVFLLFGISFLLNKKNKSFFVILVTSFTFHATAYLGSIYYFFNKKIAKKYIVLSIILAFAFGVSPLPAKIFGSLAGINEHFMSKTEAYLSSAKEATEKQGLTLAGIVKRILFFAVFLGIRDKVLVRLKNYNLFFNGYWLGILIYLIFSSSLIIMVNRGSLYFNLMEPLLVSSIFMVLSRPLDKFVCLLVVFVVAILLMYQSISGYPDAFDPYKGIWYNIDFYRQSI